MRDYQYLLVRYVPDAQRMEPINVGVILHGQGSIDVRFSPHAAKRNDVDTDAFRKWKSFLEEEITGSAVPLFQPDKDSSDFLTYLEALCEGPIQLSQALTISVPSQRAFPDVLEGLFSRLVLPREMESPVEASRPTGRFRQYEEAHRFLQRGMKRYTHVKVANEPLWTAYRQVLNGEFLAIDKVEAGREIGRTANEIDKLPRVAELLPRFVKAKVAGKTTRYVLLADELAQPFTDQTDEEFRAMQDDLDALVNRIQGVGGRVIRNPGEAEEFAKDLDQNLPKWSASSNPSETAAGSAVAGA